MRVGGDGGGREGVDEGDDGVHDEEEEADEAAEEGAEPEEAPHDAVVLLEHLVDAVRGRDPAKKVLHPRPDYSDVSIRAWRGRHERKVPQYLVVRWHDRASPQSWAAHSASARLWFINSRL